MQDFLGAFHLLGLYLIVFVVGAAVQYYRGWISFRRACYVTCLGFVLSEIGSHFDRREGGLSERPAEVAPKSIGPNVKPASQRHSFHETNASVNRPDRLMLGESIPVELVLHVNPKEDLSGYFKDLPGEVATKKIEAGDAVSASLTSDKDKLQITPRIDKAQTFTGQNLIWVWDVKPLKPGKTLVTLDILSNFKLKGIEKTFQVPALHETWEVDAVGLELLKYYWGEYEWLRTAVYGTGALLIAALGYFGLTGRGKKPEQSAS